MITQSKRFQIEELVPENMYRLLHEEVLWRMMDNRLFESIDKLKHMFEDGTITINNWVWGGSRNWSGLRTSDSPYWSPTSMHSKGMAIDAIFSAYSAEEVRQVILENQYELPYIGGIEMGVSWLHMDLRAKVNNKIVTFNA